MGYAEQSEVTPNLLKKIKELENKVQAQREIIKGAITLFNCEDMEETKFDNMVDSWLRGAIKDEK